MQVFDYEAEFLKNVHSNGFAAQCLGEDRSACPYKPGPWIVTAAWLAGYDEAAALDDGWNPETLTNKA